MHRTAVVLFNLGGPDRLESVRPFLFNLFNDPAIIRLPQPFRLVVAALIAARRAPVARKIYRHLGGGSPLLANTKAQARALEAILGDGFRVFVAMRHWHPRAARTVAEMQQWRPDEVVLLPLYPQYSTTTTQSSVLDWRRRARKAGLDAPTRLVCCYPETEGLVAAIAGRLREALARLGDTHGVARVLFSAHGLPEKIVAAGDPYRWQVERTVTGVLRVLGDAAIDYRICFQSRVGPLKWLQPAIDQEIRRAGGERKAVVVVPVSFVSEHSETLVELDIEYRRLAERCGVPRYVRVATVDCDPAFIEALARLVRSAKEPVRSAVGGRICPADRAACPLALGGQPC